MPFSKRELEVLYLLAKGANVPTIAKQLRVSPNTIKTIKSRIVFKLKGTGVTLDQLRKISPEVVLLLQHQNDD